MTHHRLSGLLFKPCPEIFLKTQRALMSPNCSKQPHLPLSHGPRVVSELRWAWVRVYSLLSPALQPHPGSGIFRLCQSGLWDYSHPCQLQWAAFSVTGIVQVLCSSSDLPPSPFKVLISNGRFRQLCRVLGVFVIYFFSTEVSV